MNQTAKVITLFELRSFQPHMATNGRDHRSSSKPDGGGSSAFELALGITAAAIVFSPLLGLFLALLLVLTVSWAFVRSSPSAVDNTFRSLQFASAALYSLGHGGNDAQKTMGIIAVLLYSQGLLGETFYVPFWVILSWLGIPSSSSHALIGGLAGAAVTKAGLGSIVTLDSTERLSSIH